MNGTSPSADSNRLLELAKTIESRLIDWLPNEVAKQQPSSPSYCLFLWYHDFSVDDCAPIYGLATSELGEACLTRLGRNANEAIWSPQQAVEDPFPGFPLAGGDCRVIDSEIAEMYELMSGPYFEKVEARTSDDDAEMEKAALAAIRGAMHKVGQAMNTQIDWSKLLPVTDDFIVLCTDYVGYWFDEDFEACVPKGKRNLLMSKKYRPF